MAHSRNFEFSVVDSSWELIDPNPDIHQLFAQFNQQFFNGTLGSVYVQWSPRMTLCAGVCKYHKRNRECSIHLSKPLLSFRPRKDLVETLLHEMIHAYLFVHDGDRERESHGPKFHEHMYRINRLTGANITVYHSFHDEVNHFKTHWWKCNGPCQSRPPYYGMVKRSMNRAPGPNDFWYKDHQQNCGGTFVKVKEPPPKQAVKRKKEPSQKSTEETENKNKITNYFTSPTSGSNSTIPSSMGSSPIVEAPKIDSSQANVEAFAGRGFVLGSIGNNAGGSANTGPSYPRKLFSADISRPAPSSSAGSQSKPGVSSSQSLPLRRGEHPLLAKWMQNHKDKPPIPRRQASATITRPPPNNVQGGAARKLSTASSSTSAKTGKQESPNVDIITLD